MFFFIYFRNQGLGKNSQTAKYSLAASSLALFDESNDEVTSYPNPNEALKKALKSLSTDTWLVFDVYTFLIISIFIVYIYCVLFISYIYIF